MTQFRSKLSVSDHNTLCQQYLTLLYDTLHTRGQNDNNKKHNLAETHGEILFEGVSKLLESLQMTNQDVFADLGSGLGKVVAQVFLQSPVSQAFGIEIMPELHQKAEAAASRLQTELPDFYEGSRQLNFLQGSFLETSFAHATVVFVNPICFDQNLLIPIGDIINQTSGIRAVVSLRPIGNLERLRFKKTIRIECSWDTALAYLYH